MEVVLPVAPPVRTPRHPRASTPTRPTRAVASTPEARADKRDAILRAAISVFAQRGFASSQVADIARAAGIATGTLYLYFRSKDELLAAIFRRMMSEAMADARAALSGLDDPAEKLRRLARGHLERVGRDREFAIVCQVEFRHSTKFMAQLSSAELQDYLGVIRDTIADGQARGVFRTPVSPTLAAKVLFGALDEMATNWILSRRRYVLTADAEAVVDLFLNGVTA